MECGNHFCVYWSDKHCVLTNISLDNHGQCRDCIHIEMDKGVLEQHRQKALDRCEREPLK